MEEHYESLHTSRVVASAALFSSEDLSSEYFSSVKDRLYCGAPNGSSRRGAQHVLHSTLHHFLSSIAPIVPFLVEEVESHLPLQQRGVGVWGGVWGGAPREWRDERLARVMRLGLATKREVNKLLHAAQLERGIKPSEALISLQAWTSYSEESSLARV